MDDRQADNHEEIGHLAYRHGVGSVAHDAEDSDEEEDSDGNDHEGEEEVAALTLLVVKELNDDPVDQEAESESQQSVGKASRK